MPFASFTQAGTTSNTGYINSLSEFSSGSYNGSFTPGVVAVKFNFVDPALQDFGALDATFSMTAFTPGTAAGGGNRRDMAISGSFWFTYNGPTVTSNGITLMTGENLLSAQFGGDSSALGGTRGSQSAGISDDTYSDDGLSISNVDYASDVLNFAGTLDRSFSLSLTSVLSSLSVNGNGRFNDFRSSAVGTFSSDPPPVLVVPEASSWMLMVLGFGAMGGSLRAARRTKVGLSHI